MKAELLMSNAAFDLLISPAVKNLFSHQGIDLKVAMKAINEPDLRNMEGVNNHWKCYIPVTMKEVWSEFTIEGLLLAYFFAERSARMAAWK